MNPIKDIILTHRAYAYVITGMIFLLLIRIPLGTFNDSSWIDAVGHFVLPAAGAPLLAALLQRIDLGHYTNKASFVFLACLLGITAEAIWEIFEYAVDVLFGLEWQPSNADTMNDIILSIVGALLGSLLFIRIYKKQL